MEYKSVLKRVLLFLGSSKFLLILIFVGMLFVILFMIVTPPYLNSFRVQREIIDEVNAVTSVNIFDENVQINTISDIENLKKVSNMHNYVYANAQNGDVVMQFSDGLLVVYRKSDKTVVYKGLYPEGLLNLQDSVLVSSIKTAMVDKGVSASVIAESAPQIVKVSDVNSVKTQADEFYSTVESGDVIAKFEDLNLIVIYRPSTQEVIKMGFYNVTL